MKKTAFLLILLFFLTSLNFVYAKDTDITPRQYLPFNYRINNINLIVYPAKDEIPLDKIFNPKNKSEMLTYLETLYQKNSKLLSKGDYHILFVWNLDGNKMTDVWIHHMKNWSDSGPLLDNYIFKNSELTQDAGIASGDSIIVLGREEELRRKLGKEIKLMDYVNRDKYMPTFPNGLSPKDSFFLD